MKLTRPAAAALLALAPALFAPPSAFAVSETDFSAKATGDLVNLCGADPKDGPMATAALNFCHGYAQGAVAVQMEMQAASKRPKLFCFPDPAPTRSQSLAEFVTWAKADPARLSQPAADGLMGFLHERFACGKK